MRDRFFYIEFAVGSEERFARLQQFFGALKRAKDKEIEAFESGEDRVADYDPLTDPQWIDYLDEEAVAWFSDTFDYNSEEGKVYRQLWNLTAPAIRVSHPMFCVPGNWDFESMLDSLFGGEYKLVDLVMEEAGKGVLYYDPWAGPFGGSECLVALIEAFGNTVTYDSWHSGPHRRLQIGWDYERAKELVSKGVGMSREQVSAAEQAAQHGAAR